MQTPTKQPEIDITKAKHRKFTTSEILNLIKEGKFNKNSIYCTWKGAPGQRNSEFYKKCTVWVIDGEVYIPQIIETLVGGLSVSKEYNTLQLIVRNNPCLLAVADIYAEYLKDAVSTGNATVPRNARVHNHVYTQTAQGHVLDSPYIRIAVKLPKGDSKNKFYTQFVRIGVKPDGCMYSYETKFSSNEEAAKAVCYGSTLKADLEPCFNKSTHGLSFSYDFIRAIYKPGVPRAESAVDDLTDEEKALLAVPDTEVTTPVKPTTSSSSSSEKNGTGTPLDEETIASTLAAMKTT